MVIKVKDGKDIELIEYIFWLTKDISKKILLKKKFLVKNSDRCIYVSISRNKRFKYFWQYDFLQNTDICNFAIFKMIFIYIFNEDKDFSFISNWSKKPKLYEINECQKSIFKTYWPNYWKIYLIFEELETIINLIVFTKIWSSISIKWPTKNEEAPYAGTCRLRCCWTEN